MHFNRPGDVPVEWDPALIACGRELIRAFPIEQVQQHTGYELGRIAAVCLRGPDGVEDARIVCRWMVERAGSSHAILWGGLDDLFEVLLSMLPQVALDAWLAEAEESRPARLLPLVRRDERNPLVKVPVPVLKEWPAKDPERRLLPLARVIPVLAGGGEGPGWSEAAIALLGDAPDRPTLLRALATRLRPSGCVGSLADILERRRGLVQRFFDDHDPAMRTAAHKIDDWLQREAMQDVASEANRDERFE